MLGRPTVSLNRVRLGRQLPPSALPRSPVPQRPPQPILRWCLIAALCACMLALALRVGSQLSAYNVQDDAYIYGRYADNLLSTGRLSWDPSGEPTYGATSHLHLALVVLVRFLLPGHPALTVGLASLLAGIIALFCMGRLVTQGVGAQGPQRLWLLLLIAIPIAESSERVAAHMTDGMDTMAALASLSVLLCLWALQQRAPTTMRVAWLSLAGAVCYASRPDLAIFALTLPIAVACIGTGVTRRLALAVLAGTGVLIGLECLGAWLYYGTPVPLSYYVKSMHSKFVAELGQHYADVPSIQLQAYVRSYWILLTLIGADLVFHFRRFATSAGGLRLGVLIATLLYVAYFSLAVMQVVAFHQRFYYPTLPALCFLGAWSALDLYRDLDLQNQAMRLRLTRAAGALAILVLLRFVLPPLLASVGTLRNEIGRQRCAHFDLIERYRGLSAHFWAGLEQFSALPDDLVIATTEIGHPAAMNPRKRVVDMVGLNESGFARDGFSAQRLFTQYRPDVCYMPHEHYTQMNAAIRSCPEFIASYELFEARDLNASMAVALRIDSPHITAMRAILQDSRKPE